MPDDFRTGRRGGAAVAGRAVAGGAAGPAPSRAAVLCSGGLDSAVLLVPVDFGSREDAG